MNKKVLELYRPNNVTINDAFDRLVVNILHERKTKESKSFVFTGCEPLVGTTTISINVAISLAMTGAKTILIDGDLRKESRYKRLSEDEAGFTDILMADCEPAEAICPTNFPTLYYLACGNSVDAPVGLLGSFNFDMFLQYLCENYDFVIFDLPSVNAVIDSAILASKVDSVVLIAKQNVTTQTQLNNARNELDKVDAKVAGIIMNAVDKAEYKNYKKDYDYFKNKKFSKKKNKI